MQPAARSEHSSELLLKWPTSETLIKIGAHHARLILGVGSPTLNLLPRKTFGRAINDRLNRSKIAIVSRASGARRNVAGW